uniref:Uncharacterized protein n=1 Tax=Zooxanthella nutricula TaxID=1333877 RepID=A0A7S2K8Q4_9DINO
MGSFATTWRAVEEKKHRLVLRLRSHLSFKLAPTSPSRGGNSCQRRLLLRCPDQVRECRLLVPQNSRVENTEWLRAGPDGGLFSTRLLLAKKEVEVCRFCKDKGEINPMMADAAECCKHCCLHTPFEPSFQRPAIALWRAIAMHQRGTVHPQHSNT